MRSGKTEREEACLNRHGFLSARGLATVDTALRASLLRLSHPLGAQVVPTTFTVTAWIVVLLVELAVLGSLVIVARRRSIATSTG